ncbi:hypothetical protein B0J13DRAFT_566540 [Dactylonectria estremocensis]|uniref:PD-(D/E)XK nuclease-like domain-containing protein n=1 Tax=Dactylonectria estremocensis TaxID=1079267 RepID=A0A9P9DQ76_9HYPO|nr:hypothetical protein B0J13DRAFT_566540 [Dactylonectria estremocensis]
MTTHADFLAQIQDWVDGISAESPSVYRWPLSPETPRYINTLGMTTPPSSGPSKRQEGSPRKRRREPDNDIFEGPTTDAPPPLYDIDQTPKSNASNNRPSLPYRLPTSARSSTNPSSTTSSHRRSNSPTKRTQNLQVLEKPIHYIALEDNATDQLPSDVRLLYNRIYNIAVEHELIFPPQARHEISKAIGRNIRDSWFSGGYTSEEDEVQEGDGHVSRSFALAELQALQDIKAEARECLRLGRSEAAWNLDVHGPLLKLALAQHRCVKKELVTTARIASPFLPPTNIPGSSVESKMIDFVLVLALDGVSSDSDKRLDESIQKKIWSQPRDRQFINQTPYPPLQFRTIAVSIETKAAGSAEEGRLQLGVWTAAWHQRMNDFFNSDSAKTRDSAQRQRTIVTLPLLLSVEHNWKLFFACDRGDRLEVVGEMSVGDTNTLIGLYTIVAVVRELANWVDSTFRKWIIDTLDLPGA